MACAWKGGYKAARARYFSKPEARAKKLAREREYYAKNKDTINSNRRRNVANSPCLRIKRNLRSRLWDYLRRDRSYKNRPSAIKDLGCTVAEFKDYISSKFKPGMSWENWGEWHIDHIKPLSTFDLTDSEQAKKACHYTNMRPLWAKDNLTRMYKPIPDDQEVASGL